MSGATVTVQANGFSNLALVDGSIATSEGKSWLGSVVDLVLSLWAADQDSYLGYGEVISATFTATTPLDSGI